MTDQLERPSSASSLPGGRAPRQGPTRRIVGIRRLVAVALVVGPLGWALIRSLPSGSTLVNDGGVRLLGGLLASVLHPALDAEFLLRVGRAAVTTIAFAAVGTLGALVIGGIGGLVLSSTVWRDHPPLLIRLVRFLLRGILVLIRSIHELVWALLLVSVLGLDPIVAVLAIAVPFGAQTAKVFAETLDGVPSGPLAALRRSGARSAPALAYGLFPGAAPLLLSYAFYRFECAIRSVVVLGVVGVGGLGEELVVSLQSRNWDEVWTLLAAVVALSALVDGWSTRLRLELAVVACSDWSAGQDQHRRTPRTTHRVWARWSAVLLVPVAVICWIVSGVSLDGLGSRRTRELTTRLIADLWPPQLPPGGWSVLTSSVLDTLAMAVLAMAVAVVITVAVGAWATTPRPDRSSAAAASGARWPRWVVWWLARSVLLVLRSVPPTIWAVIALFALFPGVLPGAIALGLYTGGILGRLVAEAWETIELRPRDALRTAGTGRSIAAAAAVVPPSTHQLIAYTLYRFEICVRDTAVVGVVGAAGLGRLLSENLAVFRFPAVTTLLAASFVVSLGAEAFGRWLRRSLKT